MLVLQASLTPAGFCGFFLHGAVFCIRTRFDSGPGGPDDGGTSVTGWNQEGGSQ